jgi:tetratricopeptide (TPR) repeat protein
MRKATVFKIVLSALRVWLDPNYSEAYINKGCTLNLLHRYVEAMETCEQALGLDPMNSKAYCYKSEALKSMGKFEDALKLAKKTIEMDPDFPAAYQSKGNALISLGRFQEALEAGENAIQIDESYSGGYLTKGAALYRLDRDEEAVQAYKIGMEISLTPCDEHVTLWFLYQQSKLLFRSGAYQECLQHLNQTQMPCKFALSWDLKFKCLLQLEKFQSLLKCGAHLKALYNSKEAMDQLSQTDRLMIEKTVGRYLRLCRMSFVDLS